MSWAKKLHRAMQMEIREHRSTFLVYSVLWIFVVGLMIFEILNRNYESMFLCILTLILLIVPSFVQVTFRIEFPTVLETIVLLFIFAAEILGEIEGFYVRFPFWDTVLHTLNGFLAAAIGFSLVDLLNKSDKLAFSLSPLFTAIVAFCFSMTIGVVWEIFEFGMDQMFNLDMQKDTIVHHISSVTLDPTGGNTPFMISDIEGVMVNGSELGLGGYLDIGLVDTMGDMIVNFLGATIFSIIGYFYVKSQGNNRIVNKFVPKRKEEEKDYLKQLNERAEARTR